MLLHINGVVCRSRAMALFQQAARVEAVSEPACHIWHGRACDELTITQACAACVSGWFAASISPRRRSRSRAFLCRRATLSPWDCPPSSRENALPGWAVARGEGDEQHTRNCGEVRAGRDPAGRRRQSIPAGSRSAHAGACPRAASAAGVPARDQIGAAHHPGTADAEAGGIDSAPRPAELLPSSRRSSWRHSFGIIFLDYADGPHRSLKSVQMHRVWIEIYRLGGRFTRLHHRDGRGERYKRTCGFTGGLAHQFTYRPMVVVAPCRSRAARCNCRTGRALKKPKQSRREIFAWAFTTLISAGCEGGDATVKKARKCPLPH